MIKHFLVALLIIVVLYLLQATVLIQASSYIYGMVPNFALVFFCLFSIQYGRLGSQILGFTAGLLQDFFSSSPICFFAMIYLLTGWVFGGMYRHTRFDNLQTVPVLVALASLGNMILAMIIGEIFGIPISSSFLSPLFWGETILNVIIGIPLYYFSKFLANKMGLSASWRRLSHD